MDDMDMGETVSWAAEYIPKTTVEVVGQSLYIWFEGELRNEDPQITVSMSGGDEDYAMIGVGNLSDAIPLGDWLEIFTIAQVFESECKRHSTDLNKKLNQKLKKYIVLDKGEK